jgi:hypothetical protein
MFCVVKKSDLIVWDISMGCLFVQLQGNRNAGEKLFEADHALYYGDANLSILTDVVALMGATRF